MNKELSMSKKGQAYTSFMNNTNTISIIVLTGFLIMTIISAFWFNVPPDYDVFIKLSSVIIGGKGAGVVAHNFSQAWSERSPSYIHPKQRRTQSETPTVNDVNAQTVGGGFTGM